jgi:hypothetical protein
MKAPHKRREPYTKNCKIVHKIPFDHPYFIVIKFDDFTGKAGAFWRHFGGIYEANARVFL